MAIEIKLSLTAKGNVSVHKKGMEATVVARVGGRVGIRKKIIAGGWLGSIGVSAINEHDYRGWLLDFEEVSPVSSGPGSAGRIGG